MRKSLLVLIALLFGLVGGVTSVKATDIKNWDPSDAFSTTWNGETNTLSWNKNWANVLYTGFAPKTNSNTTEVDLSKYDKIHYNITSLSGTASDGNGAYIELKVRSTGKDDQTIKIYEGAHDIMFADYSGTIDFSKILELTVSATYADGAEDGDPGSAVIPEMYLFTDKWVVQTQQQTIYVNALGDALSLSSVVSENTLVSLASSDGNILYGKAVDGSEYGSNQIKSASLDDAMALVSGDDNTSYQFRIIDATAEEGLVLPDGVTTLYRIKAFKKDGTTPFTGPDWNGKSSFYLQEISWTYNVADGSSAGDASFYAITPVAGKTNTYKISAYKKDGESGYKENIYNKSEWTFNVVTQTPQQKNVQVWVEDPTLEFDGNGYALVGNESLTATGGLSYNSLTGELSSDGTAGTLTLEFKSPVDLKYLNTFDVLRSGDNYGIINRLKFYDNAGTLINTWNGNKLGNAGLDDNATNAFINNNPVKKLVWESDENDGNEGKSFTISGIQFQLKLMSCIKAGETQLNTLQYYNWILSTSKWESATPTWNIRKSTDTYYGDGSSKMTHYVDLTDYSELRIYRNNSAEGFRAWFFTGTGDADKDGALVNTENSAVTWDGTNKCYVIDLTKITKFEDKLWLIAIKSSGWGVNNVINNIVVYNTPAANTPQYTLTGSGYQLSEAVAALSDATATSIDATAVKGITTNSEGGRTTLTSANPNCLFVAESGKLSNASNVIISGTCANLVLEDSYPFKAPSDFTATSASYTTTISAAGAGTLCLPFEATIPEGVTAWTLTYASGEEASATKITTGIIPANTPVLLNGSGEKTFSRSSVSIDADAINVVGVMTGVFANTAVPENSYVLQNGADGLGFYRVSSGDPITAKPFRAYLTASGVGAKLRIVYEDDATAIDDVKAQTAGDDAIYTLTGVRVAHPTKGIYVKNGRKFIVK